MKNQPHPLVAELVKNPADVPRLTALRGYLGAATQADRARIYSSPSLDSYIEVPDSAIKKIANDATDPNAASTIWLDATATASSGPDANSFLVGGIAQQYWATAQDPASPMIAPPTATLFQGCLPVTSQAAGCHSPPPPTSASVCPPTSQAAGCHPPPPATTVGCHTQYAPTCPVTTWGHCPTGPFACTTAHGCR